jgi:hypothetical protein
MASAANTQSAPQTSQLPAAQPPQQQAPATQVTNTVKLANVGALYTDKLTDTGNEH